MEANHIITGKRARVVVTDEVDYPVFPAPGDVGEVLDVDACTGRANVKFPYGTFSVAPGEIEAAEKDEVGL